MDKLNILDNQGFNPQQDQQDYLIRVQPLVRKIHRWAKIIGILGLLIAILIFLIIGFVFLETYSYYTSFDNISLKREITVLWISVTRIAKQFALLYE